MNNNRLCTYCVKDADIYLLKNINEGSGTKVQIAKLLKSSDCVQSCSKCDLLFNDVGSSNSSGNERDLHKNKFRKHSKHKPISVHKIPIKRELVKSSPCVNIKTSDCIKCVPNEVDDSRIHKKKTIRNKSEYHNIEEDIDFIPVKLISSENVLPIRFNDKSIKMNSARQNFRIKSPDRKVNSWGRILKEQHTSSAKELKKTAASAVNVKQKSVTSTNLKNQTQTHLKEKNINFENPVPQTKTTVTRHKTVGKDNAYPVVKNKSSSHTMRLEPPSLKSEYTSGSSSSITGESIMLIDRSAQCSATFLEATDGNNWCDNCNDINQAGDNGLAFLNPVRTLNFLVRELRGKLSEESEDDNMSRIIRDMENTIARLSKTPENNAKDGWNTIISEEDLKVVLELLQNTPQVSQKVSEAEKTALELQTKLEGTCCKLEDLCKQLEKTTAQKLKHEKQRLIGELTLKNEELELATARGNELQQTIGELQKKNEENSRQIVLLRESQSRTMALNAVLTEQLQDIEKKYQQAVTEMQFLKLEKEKNLVLMKCKDQDVYEMRKSLEEIKNFVIQHLSTFQLERVNSGPILDESKLDLDDMTLASTLSTTVLHNKNVNDVKKDLPVCSSPVETLSPSPEEDESWCKISNVPLTTDNVSLVKQDRLTADTDLQKRRSSQHSELQSRNLMQQQSRTACIKESLKNIFEDMKKQAKLSKTLSVQNVITLDNPVSLSNWSDLDVSDDDIRSTGCATSDCDTNLSK